MEVLPDIWFGYSFLIWNVRMDSETAESPPPQSEKVSDVGSPPVTVAEKEISAQKESSAQSSSSMLPSTALSYWAKSLKLPQMQQDNQPSNDGKLTFSRLASGLGFQFPSKAPVSTESDSNNTTPGQSGVVETFTKGIVDSSLSAVKAVQVKARHIVSQNKRRYQVAQTISVIFSL